MSTQAISPPSGLGNPDKLIVRPLQPPLIQENFGTNIAKHLEPNSRVKVIRIVMQELSMTVNRRPVLFYKSVVSQTLSRLNVDKLRDFHCKLPAYAPTRLIELPELAQDPNVKNIFIKDESDQFGLPSFKILGASWGTFIMILSLLDLY
jgi:hypothetical protein